MNAMDRDLPVSRGPARLSPPGAGRQNAPFFLTSAVESTPTESVSPESPGSSIRPEPSMKILHGLAVSPGIAIGPLIVLDSRGLRLPPRSIASCAITGELERLDRGLNAAQVAARHDEREARSRLGPLYADILAAHSSMIADPTLRRDAERLVRDERISAEHAVLEVLEGHAVRLERLADSYLAARAADVRDIESRILNHLIGESTVSFQDDLATPSLVVAPDLTPSETAGLDPARIKGFATEMGGRSSHTAIVAAALEIPAVVGLGKFLDRAVHCEMAVIDGDEGLVILNPDADTLRRYEQVRARRSARFEVLTQQADLPSRTLDGETVHLWGNIEFSAEVKGCLSRGAAGVGLFRTEFLFLNADSPPTEEQQFEAYASVVRTLAGRPVTIRTLDLGADKVAAYSKSGYLESNPALGLRSLRLSLRNSALFRPQLRAILRASALGEVRIMFPLVSTLSEVFEARDVVREVALELKAEGHSIADKVPVGIMIEVPAAALIADHLAKEVDFFSIGTNDLIQYTLAVDRTNETVAGLYCAADPSVLRLIAMVVDAARSAGIDVTVCGSMGGETLYTVLLLGLGVRDLSMAPHQLPEIKRIIRNIRLDKAQALAREALELRRAEEVVELLARALAQLEPEPETEGAPAGGFWHDSCSVGMGSEEANR
jgi:phosphotransferase system enzyme I (PtsI)